MKANLIYKITFLLICLSAFAPAAFTQQEKPQVIEFAQVEVPMGETEIDKFIEPLERFISSLKNEPKTTKGFIEVPENTILGKKIKSVVADAGFESRVSFWKAKKYPERYWFRSRVSFYLIP
ncbi:MAG TPA: hypothetical protein VK308_11935 [Pyrinomonadaceae bacterium]|nr:hypothetical protein [Pyrinomonadaceae bacterium]